MKRERLSKAAYKEWEDGTFEAIASSLVVTLMKIAFDAGWNAAIGYCMQPEESAGMEKESAGRE